MDVEQISIVISWCYHIKLQHLFSEMLIWCTHILLLNLKIPKQSYFMSCTINVHELLWVVSEIKAACIMQQEGGSSTSLCTQTTVADWSIVLLSCLLKCVNHIICILFCMHIFNKVFLLTVHRRVIPTQVKLLLS